MQSHCLCVFTCLNQNHTRLVPTFCLVSQFLFSIFFLSFFSVHFFKNLDMAVWFLEGFWHAFKKIYLKGCDARR